MLSQWVIRPAQFVFICSLPFLCLGQNLTFGAHYFPIFETWHMICKLTRAILWICCHLSKTGDQLKFIQGESWFPAPSHILEWRRCSFFTTSTLSCAHYYVLKSSSCIDSWTDVKDSSSCIQLWTRVRLDCRIWVSDFETSAASPAKTVRNCLTLLPWLLSFLRLFGGIRNILFAFQTTTQ